MTDLADLAGLPAARTLTARPAAGRHDVAPGVGDPRRPASAGLPADNAGGGDGPPSTGTAGRSRSGRPDGFGAAVGGRDDGIHWLVRAGGGRIRLPVDRWHGPAEPAVVAVLTRCAGPTLDLGCGPGRVTVALARAGLTALGVDSCARAVALTRARGAAAVRADVFDPLPAEGRWAHLVLLDGNIGIGGDPAALLRRCRALLHPAGTLLVELDPPGSGTWQGQAYVLSGAYRGPGFRWARLDTGAVAAPAAAAGLTVRELFRHGRRWFAELARP